MVVRSPRFPSLLGVIKEQRVGSVNHKPSGQDLWAKTHKYGHGYLRWMARRLRHDRVGHEARKAFVPDVRQTA
jgi:hypothetical protein